MCPPPNCQPERKWVLMHTRLLCSLRAIISGDPTWFVSGEEAGVDKKLPSSLILIRSVLLKHNFKG